MLIPVPYGKVHGNRKNTRLISVPWPWTVCVRKTETKVFGCHGKNNAARCNCVFLKTMLHLVEKIDESHNCGIDELGNWFDEKILKPEHSILFYLRIFDAMFFFANWNNFNLHTYTHKFSNHFKGNKIRVIQFCIFGTPTSSCIIFMTMVLHNDSKALANEMHQFLRSETINRRQPRHPGASHKAIESKFSVMHCGW